MTKKPMTAEQAARILILEDNAQREFYKEYVEASQFLSTLSVPEFTPRLPDKPFHLYTLLERIKLYKELP